MTISFSVANALHLQHIYRAVTPLLLSSSFDDMRPLTLQEACIALAIDSATLWRWCKQAHISPAQDIYDKRRRTLSAMQVQRLAELHHISLDVTQEKREQVPDDVVHRLAQLEERIGHLEGIVGALTPQTSPTAGTSQQTPPALSQPQGGASTLPEGAMLLFAFARAHGVNAGTAKTQARAGRFAYSERIKPNRLREHDKYLTMEQQRRVIAFWQRNGTPFIECPNCPH